MVADLNCNVRGAEDAVLFVNRGGRARKSSAIRHVRVSNRLAGRMAPAPGSDRYNEHRIFGVPVSRVLVQEIRPLIAGASTPTLRREPRIHVSTSACFGNGQR